MLIQEKAVQIIEIIITKVVKDDSDIDWATEAKYMEKEEQMRKQFTGKMGVTRKGDVFTKLSENVNGLCRRDHTYDGCIGIVNWYKDSRYNKLDKITF